MGDVTRTAIINGVAVSQDPQSTSAMGQQAGSGHDRDLKAAFNTQGTNRVSIGSQGQGHVVDGPSRTTIRNDTQPSAESLSFTTPDGRTIGDHTAVKGSDYVQIGGTFTTVAAAMRQGLIQKQGAGYYSMSPEMQGIQQAAADRQAQANQTYEVDLIPSDHKETFSELSRKMGGNAFGSAMALLINEMVKPDGQGNASEILGQISRSTGAEPTSLHAWAEEYINETFSNGVDWVARTYGLDADAAAEWAMNNWSTRAKSQFVRACTSNNVRDLKNFALAIKNRDRI